MNKKQSEESLQILSGLRERLRNAGRIPNGENDEATRVSAAVLAETRTEVRVRLSDERAALSPEIEAARASAEQAAEPVRQLTKERADFLRKFGPEGVPVALGREIRKASGPRKDASEKLAALESRLRDIDTELHTLEVVTDLPSGADEKLRKRQRALDIEARGAIDQKQLEEQIGVARQALELLEKAQEAANGARDGRLAERQERLFAQQKTVLAHIEREGKNKQREESVLAEVESEIEKLMQRFPGVPLGDAVPGPLLEQKDKAESVLGQINRNLRKYQAQADALAAQISEIEAEIGQAKAAA